MQTLQGMGDVYDVTSLWAKYDAAGGARGLLFTSSRNAGSAAGEEEEEGAVVKL